MSNSISKGFIEECGAEFRADRANRVAMDAVMTNGLNKSCLNHDARRRTTHTFSISLEQGSRRTRGVKNAVSDRVNRE